jgi:hypothetical protein
VPLAWSLTPIFWYKKGLVGKKVIYYNMFVGKLNIKNRCSSGRE